MHIRRFHRWRPIGHRTRLAAGLASTLVIALAATACGSAGASRTADAATTGAGASGAGTTVTLVTHDSFAVQKKVLDAFEKSSGITVKVLAQGDAGAMLSKVILTKDNPLGDAVFGIDNTFASKALAAGILVPYTSALASQGSDRFAAGTDGKLTPIDYGDVCVNIDHAYFTKHHLAEPKTFEDLAKPEYRNLFVTEDAATSSPGLAFLLATIAHFGPNHWQAYWKSLEKNGLAVESGWTEAYSVDFSGSTGKGDRPLVVSYASSPPDEVHGNPPTSPTSALLDTCFRQVEYAGVLAGAKHPKAAEKVIDFLLSRAFQDQIPDQMYMYPVNKDAPLPADWKKFAPLAQHPETLSPKEIQTHRQQWITTWSDIVHS